MEFDRKTILTEVVVKQSLQRAGMAVAVEATKTTTLQVPIPTVIAVVSGDTTRPKVH